MRKSYSPRYFHKVKLLLVIAAIAMLMLLTYPAMRSLDQIEIRNNGKFVRFKAISLTCGHGTEFDVLENIRESPFIGPGDSLYLSGDDFSCNQGTNLNPSILEEFGVDEVVEALIGATGALPMESHTVCILPAESVQVIYLADRYVKYRLQNWRYWLYGVRLTLSINDEFLIQVEYNQRTTYNDE